MLSSFDCAAAHVAGAPTASSKNVNGVYSSLQGVRKTGVLNTASELADALGDVAVFEDPLAELQKGGLTFSGDLAGVGSNASSQPAAPAAVCNKVKAMAEHAGKVTVRVADGAPVAPASPLMFTFPTTLAAHP